MITLRLASVLMASVVVLAEDTEYPVDPTGRLSVDRISQVCDNRIRTAMTTWAGFYDYTPEQAALIRERLEVLKDLQIRHTMGTAEARWKAYEESRSVYRQNATRPAGEEPLPRYLELKSIFEELREADPLFNAENLRHDIEQFLTAEQIEMGQRRWDIQQAKAMTHMDRMMKQGAMKRQGTSMALSRDGWEKYVQRFCLVFHLSEPQQATAMSVLRDAVAQRDAVIEQHREAWERDLNEIKVGEDSPVLAVERIWKRMCAQLDGVPTESQMADAVALRMKSGIRWTPTRPTEVLLGRALDFDLYKHATTQPADAPAGPPATLPALAAPEPATVGE